MNDPVKLYQAANSAAADAARLRRSGNGCLAKVRRMDALALRSKAGEILRQAVA